MNFDNLARIAQDDDFKAFLSDIKERLTKTVMSLTTTQEDRDAALAEYHAVQRIEGRLASVIYEAQQKEK